MDLARADHALRAADWRALCRLLSLTRSPGLGDRFPFIAAVSAAMVFTPFAIAFLTGRLLGVQLGARTWRAKLLVALLFAATVSVGAGIGWWVS